MLFDLWSNKGAIEVGATNSRWGLIINRSVDEAERIFQKASSHKHKRSKFNEVRAGSARKRAGLLSKSLLKWLSERDVALLKTSRLLESQKKRKGFTLKLAAFVTNWPAIILNIFFAK